jgi:ATP-binding cassette subfamily B protein
MKSLLKKGEHRNGYSTAANTMFVIKTLWRCSVGKILYTLAYSVLFSIELFMAINLFFFRFVVRTAESGGDYSLVLPPLLLLCGIYVVRSVANEIANVTIVPKITRKVRFNLRNIVMDKALACDLECYENAEYFDTYTRAMNECNERFDEVLTTVLDSFANIFSFPLSIALAVAIDPWLLAVLLLPIISAVLANKQKRNEYNKTMELTTSEREEAYVTGTFYGVEAAKELRLSRIHIPLISMFANAIHRSQKILRKYGKRDAIFHILISSLGTTLPIMLYAAYKVLVAKTMTFADALIATDALYVIWSQLSINAERIAQLRQLAMYIGNLRRFLEYEPKIHANESGMDAEMDAISFDNVSFTYPGSDAPALRNISLKFNKGQKIMIVGLNGAGKSTLIKLLLRLYLPDSGRIILGDRDVADYSLSTYRGLFSTVMQDFKLFSLSVKENVLLREFSDDDDEDAEIVKQAIELSGLKARIDNMPKRENTIIGREYDEAGELLSGGEGQKLAVSRVFAKGAPIIILDEPSSALDPIAEDEMYEQMIALGENKTVVYISHRLSSAKLADVIYVIDDGCVVEFGTHDELLSRNGKYAHLFSLQASGYKEGEKYE